MAKINYEGVIELYESGLSCRQISKKTNSNPTSIHKFLVKNNVKMRPAGYQKGHKFCKGGEKGWFKEGQSPSNKGKPMNSWMSKEANKLRKNKISQTLRRLSCIPSDIHVKAHWHYEKMNGINRYGGD